MSVPKKKLSKRRTRARRSHHKATASHGIQSPIPGDDSIIRPHHSHEYNGKVYTWQELKKLMGGQKKRAELQEEKAEAAAEEAPVEEAPVEEVAQEEAPAEEAAEEKTEESDEDAK